MYNKATPYLRDKVVATKKSICILRLSALGDCINAFAFAQGLVNCNERYHVTLILDKRFAPLFSNERLCSKIEIIGIDLKKYGLLKARSKLKEKLSGRKFNLLFNIQTSLKASLLSTAIKADIKVGYDKQRSREGQFLFVNKRALEALGDHVIDGFLGFSKLFGLKVEPDFNLHLLRSEIEDARVLADTDKDIFLLSPCSAKKAKNWTFEGYTKVIEHMASRNFAIVLSAGSSAYEIEYCQKIKDHMSHCGIDVINLAGKTTLRDLAALCSISTIALCPDSGTMHLCNAVNTKVVGLFAIHNPKRVGPYNFMDYIVSVYDELAQKELGSKAVSWRYRVKDEHAMEHIKPLAVIDMLDKVIESNV